MASGSESAFLTSSQVMPTLPALDYTKQNEGAGCPGMCTGESAHVGLGSEARTRLTGLEVSREQAKHLKHVEGRLAEVAPWREAKPSGHGLGSLLGRSARAEPVNETQALGEGSCAPGLSSSAWKLSLTWAGDWKSRSRWCQCVCKGDRSHTLGRRCQQGNWGQLWPAPAHLLLRAALRQLHLSPRWRGAACASFHKEQTESRPTISCSQPSQSSCLCSGRCCLCLSPDRSF